MSDIKLSEMGKLYPYVGIFSSNNNLSQFTGSGSSGVLISNVSQFSLFFICQKFEKFFDINFRDIRRVEKVHPSGQNSLGRNFKPCDPLHEFPIVPAPCPEKLHEPPKKNVIHSLHEIWSENILEVSYPSVGVSQKGIV